MRITYLFDALCGWCYGAGPSIERLAALEDVTVELAPTGLFAGAGARSMDAGFAAYAWQNDQRIARLTGQPFTEVYRSQVLGATGSLFDSAPATLGIVATGIEAPGREIEILKRLQRARYEEGRDIADRAIVADLLAEAALTDQAQRVRSPDEELLAAYHRRIDTARADMRRFGVDGVPALVLDDGAGRRLLRGNALFGHFDLLLAEMRAA
ncbi:DsbA family protein [Rhizobium hidalgonense]|uniref:DsbA family protein n=1 Tax=Rhizobium hidalgonense TaxID=1538159 RepID=UPI002871A189|nr:DsbA family protein [Rhizobium hidalgonense]MDR9811973.1 DsbA family protein [Rhizobium hidalgonense]